MCMFATSQFGRKTRHPKCALVEPHGQPILIDLMRLHVGPTLLFESCSRLLGFLPGAARFGGDTQPYKDLRRAPARPTLRGGTKDGGLEGPRHPARFARGLQKAEGDVTVLAPIGGVAAAIEELAESLQQGTQCCPCPIAPRGRPLCRPSLPALLLLLLLLMCCSCCYCCNRCGCCYCCACCSPWCYSSNCCCCCRVIIVMCVLVLVVWRRCFVVVVVLLRFSLPWLLFSLLLSLSF